MEKTFHVALGASSEPPIFLCVLFLVFLSHLAANVPSGIFQAFAGSECAIRRLSAAILRNRFPVLWIFQQTTCTVDGCAENAAEYGNHGLCRRGHVADV